VELTDGAASLEDGAAQGQAGHAQRGQGAFHFPGLVFLTKTQRRFVTHL